jgi:hypothetical protein
MDYDDLTEFDDESLNSAYTVGELELRRKFVTAYLQIGDPVKALLNVHTVPYGMAAYHGRLFMNEPFVKHLLKVEKVRLEATSDENIDDMLRKEVMMAYRGVMNNTDSKGSEVVAAASKLAELMALNKPSESKLTVEMNGGIMRVPTLVDNTGSVIDVDTFSVLAQKQQSELRQKVLESVVDNENN